MATKDLTGRVFSRLTVIQKAPSIILGNGERCGAWECQCSCGKIKIAKTNDLTSGRLKSCGCWKQDSRTLKPGEKFNRWTTIEYKGVSKWLCQCECGTQSIVAQDNLKGGGSKSCGCWKSETSAINIQAAIKSIRKFTPDISTARGVWRNYRSHEPEFIMSFDEFYQFTQQNCIYCNIEPHTKYNKFLPISRGGSEYAKEDGWFHYNGLDRVSSAGNHTIDNIVPSCAPCNRAKNDRSLLQFIQWVPTLQIKKFVPVIIKPSSLPILLFSSIEHTFSNYEHDTDMTIEEYYAVSQMNCFYCDLSPMHSNFYAKEFHYNGMDRVSRDRPHFKDNIVPCCRWCNWAKWALTLSDFHDWIRRIQSHILLPGTPLQLLLQQERAKQHLIQT